MRKQDFSTRDKRDALLFRTLGKNLTQTLRQIIIFPISMRVMKNGKRDIAFYQNVKRDIPMENLFSRNRG